ncbi:MAG: lytic transglycosylase domain-containing protein [Burkholderiales bacterium]|nr:lytic transglycosylase domain-containing protein [Burkholderiales bacterium]
MSGLLVASACARADLYGYIDEKGQIHLANEKLDARYELFVKGETTTEFKRVLDSGRDSEIAAELKYLPVPDDLADHVIFRRLQKSPNVARFESLVLAAAERQRLDAALVKAVIAVESAYEPQAVSRKGAMGLMQLIPGTAERFGVKRSFDPEENIRGGTRYLRELIDLFKGDLSLALAGYNAGEGAVQRFRNTIPPFPETQAYVKLVLRFYEHFGGGARRGPAMPPAVSQSERDRIRITLPARSNLPPGGRHVPGLMRDPAAAAATEPATR